MNRIVSTLLALIAAASVGRGPSDAATRTSSDQPAIDRVEEIRNALLAQDQVGPVGKEETETAQWFNWSNWRNR